MSTIHDKQSVYDKNLGIAGIMARAFIHSPLSPLFLVACLVLGMMGLVFTPRQEDPQISVPMVDIFVRYPGASSEQVATLVADPLERIMSEIHGVKHVYSASMRGMAMITVQFVVGEDMEESLVKLYDRIHSNMDKVPPGVEKPLIKPKAVDDVPVVTLTLWSNDVDDATLRALGLDVQQRLKEVKDTNQGFIVGGRSEQIRVEVLPERLSGYGISLDQIAGTIKTANSEKGIGGLESGDTAYRVYTGAFLKNANEISRLVVGMHNNTPVYVGDVAYVSAMPEETRQMALYYSGQAYSLGTPPADGAPAVTLALAKKKGSNGVTVADQILAKVEELKGPLIPSNVHVAVTRNYGETANEKVNELLFKLMIATLAVTLLVWYSLGFRPSVVTLVVIPVVILMTVFAAGIMGYTIDRVSLFALIFSIGILVDDAIVVVENIYRRWLMEHDCCEDVSVDAVREVGNPTILATFTVIAALLPMGFVSGMMGPYMEPIPALGSVAMLFSLFAAFIFTPWLAQLIQPSMDALHKYSEREHRSVEKMEKFYRWLIPQMLDSKVLGYGFLFGLVGLFFLSMLLFYTTDVTVKILPLDNKPEFNVVINMPEGTALPKTANLAQRMTEKLREEIPEITALQTYIGTASPYNFNGMVRHYYLRREPWMADIQVQLLHKNDRERTSNDLAVLARALLTPLAEKVGGRVQIVEMPPGPPVLQSVVAEVTGPDAGIRREVAKKMEQFFKDAPNIVDVDTYIEDPYEIWRFEVDTEKAVRRGVSVDAINRNLGLAMGGAKIGDIKRGHVLEPTYIVLQVPLNIRAQIGSLYDIPISTPMGTTIPLAELGRFVKGKQDPVIYHKDLRPVEYVTGEVEGRLDAPIYGMFDVEDMLKEYTTPDEKVMSGYFMGPPESYSRSAFEWTGEWTVTYETFRDMGIAFGAALILIYMLVVWEFGNFTLPAIIMAPIPLTLLGIVPGHWLLDAKFTATSMIGFIALAGIIVRNSILLVDFVQQEILRGTDIRDAVILSCKARTRPILITAFALVAGSSVILTDFIFQGMAISLLFGVLVSTLLTLLVIPLGCVTAESAFVQPDYSEMPEKEKQRRAAELAARKFLEDEEKGVQSSAAANFLEKYNPEIASSKPGKGCLTPESPAKKQPSSTVEQTKPASPAAALKKEAEKETSASKKEKTAADTAKTSARSTKSAPAKKPATEASKTKSAPAKKPAAKASKSKSSPAKKSAAEASQSESSPAKKQEAAKKAAPKKRTRSSTTGRKTKAAAKKRTTATAKADTADKETKPETKRSKASTGKRRGIRLKSKSGDPDKTS
ncbi:MAG: efflux RND transporter permease subunit [Magnetococcales bacterium]|nr:efflux RND transporter permease subunit [Magnetococcales bacterium]